MASFSASRQSRRCLTSPRINITWQPHFRLHGRLFSNTPCRGWKSPWYFQSAAILKEEQRSRFSSMMGFFSSSSFSCLLFSSASSSVFLRPPFLLHPIFKICLKYRLISLFVTLINKISDCERVYSRWTTNSLLLTPHPYPYPYPTPPQRTEPPLQDAHKYFTLATYSSTSDVHNNLGNCCC